jgi:HK97 family phage prohead protease
MTMKKKVCNADDNCTLCSVDKENREIKFYAAVFSPSVDSWGRSYDPKSFNRTIKNSGGKIPLLIEHNLSDVVGKSFEMGTDDKGVWVKARISNTTRGDDVLELFQEGVYNSFSFSGYIYNSEPKVINNSEVEYVTEASMYESSIVLFPANPDARILSIENNDIPTSNIDVEVAEPEEVEHPEIKEIDNSPEESPSPATEHAGSSDQEVDDNIISILHYIKKYDL